MCTAHGISPKRGDILFIRTGSLVEWGTFSEQQKQDYAAQKEPQHAGVEASLETLEWIWDSGIVAVAGDAISFEVYPTPGEVSMHEYLLAGWGCPIGMWISIRISITVQFPTFKCGYFVRGFIF
jgi:kynurenine formamidase